VLPLAIFITQFPVVLSSVQYRLIVKFTALALLLLPFSTAVAQDMKTIEQNLLQVFQRIKYWNSYSDLDSTINRYDSLEAANTRFQRALTQSTTQFPATLQYGFRQLQDSGMVIATSPDRKLRVYSWNSHTGGSMVIYERVFQYLTPTGVRSTDQTGSDEHDGVEWIWKIAPFHTRNHTYYLAFSRAITCGACRSEAVKAYSIATRNLQGPLPLFMSDGVKNAVLSVDFRDFGRTAPLKSGHAIVYDSVHHSFRVPSTDEMDGTLSAPYHIYRWTGNYFAKQ